MVEIFTFTDLLDMPQTSRPQEDSNLRLMFRLASVFSRTNSCRQLSPQNQMTSLPIFSKVL